MTMKMFGLLLMVVASLPGQQAPDFSGNWTMDARRSESAHQDVPIGPVSMVITQTPTEITIETIRREAKKPTAVREALTYRLDNTETRTSADPEHSVVTKAHWDGAALVTETTRNVQDSTVTTLYVHRMAEDGKELVVEKTLMVQHGYQFPQAKTTGRGTDVFTRK